MGPSSLSLQRSPRALVTAGALLAATLAATLLVHSAALGVAFLIALVFVPLAFVHPTVALLGWIVTAFLSSLPGTHGAGTNYAVLVVFVAWIGSVAAGNVALRDFVRERAWQFATVLGLLLWMGLTLLWAPNPSAAGATMLHFGIGAAVLVMVVSLVQRPDQARWVALAFVIGAVLSVLAGAVLGGLHVGSSAVDSATSDQGRLQGGTSDPNYLAAAIVPAIMLAGGVAARRGRPLMRLALGAAVALLAIGLAATESRGGLLAAVVVCAGALLVFRGRRASIAAFIVVLAVAAAAWFAASPASWQRVTSNADDGSGRTDVWTVAWRVVSDRPFTGVGLSQFPTVSPRYLEQPGAIARGDLLVDQHIVVHNAYLQMWAETGIVGLGLFLAIALGSLVAAWKAAGRFDAVGDTDLATLARAALLALLGALTASFFLSNFDDRRLWVLLGLGPALLGLSARIARPRVLP